MTGEPTAEQVRAAAEVLAAELFRSRTTTWERVDNATRRDMIDRLLPLASDVLRAVVRA